MKAKKLYEDKVADFINLINLRKISNCNMVVRLNIVAGSFFGK